MDQDGAQRGPDGPLDPRDEPAPARHADAGADGGDPLVAARIELDGVLERPLDERAPVFDRVHATVVEELRQLELG